MALFGASIVKYAHVPGGVIKKSVYSVEKPKAFHEDKELLVIESQKKNHYTVLAGVPLSYKVGEKFSIVVENKNSITEFNPTIKNKEYKKQYITLKTNKHVKLSNTNLDRHYMEKKKSSEVLNSYTKKKFKTLTMIKPVNSKLSDDFGKRRYFNKNPRKPHSGVDMSGKVGTPIVAPLSGKVAIAQEFFFSGNVVYIDHGLGLITMYAHMNEIFVKEGQMVTQGEKIGTVGKTGRATGPHLHWGVGVNGAMVDPRIFVQ